MTEARAATAQRGMTVFMVMTSSSSQWPRRDSLGSAEEMADPEESAVTEEGEATYNSSSLNKIWT